MTAVLGGVIALLTSGAASAASFPYSDYVFRYSTSGAPCPAAYWDAPAANAGGYFRVRACAYPPTSSNAVKAQFYDTVTFNGVSGSATMSSTISITVKIGASPRICICIHSSGVTVRVGHTIWDNTNGQTWSAWSWSDSQGWGYKAYGTTIYPSMAFYKTNGHSYTYMVTVEVVAWQTGGDSADGKVEGTLVYIKLT
ncbi:MAG TPA: hypothetical protein VI893_06955 [Thermoplasmata archaeon]|nr:hypothetical protein [Thermoplasmata archaeon]